MSSMWSTINCVGFIASSSAKDDEDDDVCVDVDEEEEIVDVDEDLDEDDDEDDDEDISLSDVEDDDEIEGCGKSRETDDKYSSYEKEESLILRGDITYVMKYQRWGMAV